MLTWLKKTTGSNKAGSCGSVSEIGTHILFFTQQRANAFSVIEDTDDTIVFHEKRIAKVIVNYFQLLFSSIGREHRRHSRLCSVVNGDAPQYMDQYMEPGPDGVQDD